MSYDLATIYKEVPMEISIPDIKLKNKNSDKLNEMYKELEFYSFLKKEEKKVDNNIEVKIIENTSEINVQKDSAYYLEILGTNYHSSKILGMAIYNEDNSFYIPFEILEKKHDFLDKLKYTYDYKKNYVALKKHIKY